ATAYWMVGQRRLRPMHFYGQRRIPGSFPSTCPSMGKDSGSQTAAWLLGFSLFCPFHSERTMYIYCCVMTACCSRIQKFAWMNGGSRWHGVRFHNSQKGPEPH